MPGAPFGSHVHLHCTGALLRTAAARHMRAVLGAAPRGGRCVSFGRPAPGRAFARRPVRFRCGAVPRPPAALGSGVGGPPARFRAPGWGRGLSPFGALLLFGGALLPLFSSPPPPPVAVRLFSRFLYQSAYSRGPESKGIPSRHSAVVAAAAAETVPLSRRGKTAQGYRAASVWLRSVRFQLRY